MVSQQCPYNPYAANHCIYNLEISRQNTAIEANPDMLYWHISKAIIYQEIYCLNILTRVLSGLKRHTINTMTRIPVLSWSFPISLFHTFFSQSQLFYQNKGEKGLKISSDNRYPKTILVCQTWTGFFFLNPNTGQICTKVRI